MNAAMLDQKINEFGRQLMGEFIPNFVERHAEELGVSTLAEKMALIDAFRERVRVKGKARAKNGLPVVK